MAGWQLAVGGQQKPHTVAQAIVQLEYRRDLAARSDEPAVAVQAGGPAVPPQRFAAAPPPPPQPPPPPPAAAAKTALVEVQRRVALAMREEQIATAAVVKARTAAVALRQQAADLNAQADAVYAMPLGSRTQRPAAAGRRRRAARRNGI